MGAIYEVYIDVLAANNFLADLAALLAVKIFLKRKVRARRILAGAALGTLGNCIAFVLCRNMAAYLLLVHFVWNPFVLVFCYREKSRKDFFADLWAGYFAFLVMGGLMEWLYAGGRGGFSYEAAAVISLLLLTVAVLWTRKQLKDRNRYAQVRICQGGKHIQIQALLDSGNLLRDPYVGKPVSMIDRRVYETAYGQPQGVRLIPYESLGCPHGLLEAVTAEELSFAYDNSGWDVEKAVLGLAEHALFEKKPYQMILNPQELPEEETGT